MFVCLYSLHRVITLMLCSTFHGQDLSVARIGSILNYLGRFYLTKIFNTVFDNLKFECHHDNKYKSNVK